MRKEDKEAIIKLYEDRYAQMGYDVRTLGWRSRDDQVLRFKILSDIADLSGASICDVGCGFGDLCDYLQSRFTGFTYTGIDISPSLVRKATELHPRHKFYCIDIIEENFTEQLDYFLLSGALNYRVENNMETSTNMISRMFALANKGVGVNFLTTYVNFQRDYNYHHNPEAMFTFGRTLTKWVTIRHDYPLWEFTMYLYKEPQS